MLTEIANRLDMTNDQGEVGDWIAKKMDLNVPLRKVVNSPQILPFGFTREETKMMVKFAVVWSVCNALEIPFTSDIPPSNFLGLEIEQSCCHDTNAR